MKKLLLSLLCFTVLATDDLTKALRSETELLGTATEKSHPVLFNMIKETAEQIGLKPAPKKIYLYDENKKINNNAFVMPDGKCFIGKKLLQTMTYDELKGIITHEMSHIKNKHGLKTMLAIYSYIGITLTAIYLMHKKLDPFVEKIAPHLSYVILTPLELKRALLSITGELSIIAALPAFCKLMRDQEKDADLTALKTTEPKFLASALLKIKKNSQGMNLVSKMNMLPLPKVVKNLFRTHPRMKDRVAYLMKEQERLEQTKVA